MNDCDIRGENAKVFFLPIIFTSYIDVSSVDAISSRIDELEEDNNFQHVRSNKFSRNMSVVIVSMSGYTKKLMVGKEKKMRSQISGGLKGPEVRTVKAGGMRKANVKVIRTTHEVKWPSALTTLRWCLLVDMLRLFLMMYFIEAADSIFVCLTRIAT